MWAETSQYDQCQHSPAPGEPHPHPKLSEAVHRTSVLSQHLPGAGANIRQHYNFKLPVQVFADKVSKTKLFVRTSGLSPLMSQERRPSYREAAAIVFSCHLILAT